MAGLSAGVGADGVVCMPSPAWLEKQRAPAPWVVSAVLRWHRAARCHCLCAGEGSGAVSLMEEGLGRFPNDDAGRPLRLALNVMLAKPSQEAPLGEALPG